MKAIKTTIISLIFFLAITPHVYSHQQAMPNIISSTLIYEFPENKSSSLSYFHTQDGGYLQFGYHDFYPQYNEELGKEEEMIFVLEKMDDQWNPLWELSIGGLKISEVHTSLVEAANGDFMIVGTLDDAPYILRLDSNGHTIWEQTLSIDFYTSKTILSDEERLWAYPFINKGLGITESVDEHYFVLSYLGRSGDYYITKITGEGKTIWNKKIINEHSILYPSENHIFFPTLSIRYIHGTKDGGLLAFDRIYDKTIDGFIYYQAFVLKIDENGAIEWSQSFGGDRG